MKQKKFKIKNARNERTGKRVAVVAGKVLASLSHIQDERNPGSCQCGIHQAVRSLGITVADLKALAASALTQSPNRKETT